MENVVKLIKDGIPVICDVERSQHYIDKGFSFLTEQKAKKKEKMFVKAEKKQTLRRKRGEEIGK